MTIIEKITNAMDLDTFLYLIENEYLNTETLQNIFGLTSQDLADLQDFIQTI